jgi:hypothetical protein
VDAGVMAGAGRDDLPAALDDLLYNREVRDGLCHRAAAFAARYEMRGEGQAASRAADAILDMAGPKPAS